MSLVCQFFAIIGLISIVKILFSIFSFIRFHFLSKSHLKKLLSNDSWAIITGATDGIGKEYALQLAAQGFNIVLVSRTLSKLKEVSETIENLGRKTKIIAIDFSKVTELEYSNFEKEIKDLSIRVLVNNVGLSNDYPDYFTETPLQRFKDIINININATVEVTKIVTPILIKEKKGLIINISSAAAVIPSPLLSVYGASKAFVDSWSLAIASELAPKGVRVECQVPFFVVSNMSKRRRATLDTPSPKTYVKSALSKIGHQYYYSPYIVHSIMLGLIQFAKEILPLSFFVKQNKKLHEDIRKRALKKQQTSTQ
eukprot:TRINITY_DN726_c2_g1_i1.p1 TRINITY_DN726_c2_g1~~TRINITY_DN726_c2_g1_i1.p1  ORF type:complete len:312 (-),score=133.33 TRINITY_DN726_c2_g1_i1:85-1020(-)